MKTFKQYINEWVFRPGGNGPEQYSSEDNPDDYIVPFDKLTLIPPVSKKQFKYCAFRVKRGTGNKTRGFRTLKNASRHYFTGGEIGPPNLSDVHLYNMDQEEGGGTLAPADYEQMINDALKWFKEKLWKNEISDLPTHIITPSSSSPHAKDFGERIHKFVTHYAEYLNRKRNTGSIYSSQKVYNGNFSPGILKKSTKAQIFSRLFNIWPVDAPNVTQDRIDNEIHLYNTDPGFKNYIDDRILKLFINVNVNPNDIEEIQNAFIRFLGNHNIPVDKQISMADHLRVGDKHARDQMVIGYFDNAEDLIGILNQSQPVKKNIWVVDDNVSLGSTVNAGNEFIQRTDPNSKISWIFLLSY